MLNIKSKEAHELAATLATLTGKSMTAVVIDALRQQLKEQEKRQNKEQLFAELMGVGQRCAAHVPQPVTAVAHGDLLYDEAGLPA